MPCVFLKPVTPSKTLAKYLASNTNLPSLVWWIILKFKYDFEEDNINISNTPNQIIHKLRSGKKYLSMNDFSNLSDSFFDHSHKLLNKYSYTKQSNAKGNIRHDKKIYDCLNYQINFVIEWIHISLINSKRSEYMSTFLNRGLFNSITAIYNEVHGKAHIFKTKQYYYWCLQIVNDLKKIKDYSKCPCNWRDNPKNKCEECCKFEQYIYNYSSYINNCMVLRSGKTIFKRGGLERKPIIIQKVYMVI